VGVYGIEFGPGVLYCTKEFDGYLRSWKIRQCSNPDDAVEVCSPWLVWVDLSTRTRLKRQKTTGTHYAEGCGSQPIYWRERCYETNLVIISNWLITKEMWGILWAHLTINNIELKSENQKINLPGHFNHVLWLRKCGMDVIRPVSQSNGFYVAGTPKWDANATPWSIIHEHVTPDCLKRHSWNATLARPITVLHMHGFIDRIPHVWHWPHILPRPFQGLP